MGKTIIIPNTDYRESAIPIAKVSESARSITLYVNGTSWNYNQTPAVRNNCVEIEVPLYDGTYIVDIDFGDTPVTNLTAFTNKYKSADPYFFLVGDVDFSCAAIGVTNYTSAFNRQGNMTKLDLTGWFLSGSQYNIEYMFYMCGALEEIVGLSGDFICKASLDSAFTFCSSLKSIDFSNVTSSSLANCSQTFYGCSSLEYLDLHGLNVSSCTNFSNMFRNCSNLKTIDMSGWEVSSSSNKGNMFDGCGVEKIYVDGCSADSISVLLGQLGTGWSESTEDERAVLVKA